MRLVECTDDNQSHHPVNSYTQILKDEEISSPHTLQNMDKEMKNILADTTTDINQKCLLYHQVLQRYLGFIKRMQVDSLTPPISSQGGLEPSSCEGFNADHESQREKRVTSTPKKSSSRRQSLSELPIRIRNQILRRERRMRELNNKVALSKSRSVARNSAVLDEFLDDDDDDVYLSGDDDDDVSNTTLAGVVNGWAESNIQH